MSTFSPPLKLIERSLALKCLSTFSPLESLSHERSLGKHGSKAVRLLPKLAPAQIKARAASQVREASGPRNPVQHLLLHLHPLLLLHLLPELEKLSGSSILYNFFLSIMCFLYFIFSTFYIIFLSFFVLKQSQSNQCRTPGDKFVEKIEERGKTR